jgi:tetratricopeptide (TPR) repeat protein
LGAIDARLGRARDALAAADELERRRTGDRRDAFAAQLARSVRAQVARAAGKPAEALRILAATQPETWYQLAITSPFYSGACERYLRAELLRELGRHEEALAWYSALGESSPYELIYLAPAHLRQAQIHEQLGRRDRAVFHAARAAEIWDSCDADLRPSVGAAPGRPSVGVQAQ